MPEYLNGKAATGPLIMEQIGHLAEDVKAVRETQERRGRQVLHLSQQIDRFLAAEIDLTGTLVQLRELARVNSAGLEELRRALQQLERTVHGVLALAVGDPGTQEKENGR